MNFLINQVQEQKFLELEVSVAQFIKDNNITENMIIFKIELDKELYKEEKEVREYLKDKYYYSPAIQEEGDKFVASVLSDRQIDEDTIVEVEIRRGVLVYAAELLPIMVMEEIRFNDKGEVNLSSKFDGVINLSDGAPHVIQIARVAEGEHPSYGKLNITQEVLESMVNNFKSKVVGVDLAINEDHKKNEAFGWLEDVWLSYDSQTLYGAVKWNKKGTTALSEKEYRYFSPEFRFNYVHPHTGNEHGATLLGGALTNYPFLKMEAITELNFKKEGDDVKTIDLAVHEEKVVELNAKITDIQGKLDATQAQNVELNNKLEKMEADKKEADRKAENQKLFDAGKVNAAQLVALNEGKSIVEVLDLNDKLNTAPRGSDVKGDDVTVNLNESDKAMAKALGLTEEEFVNNNKQN